MIGQQLVQYDNRTDAELQAEAEQQTRQYIAKLQGTALVPKGEPPQMPAMAVDINSLGIKAFDNLFVATFYAHEAAQGGVKEIYAHRLSGFMSAYQNDGRRSLQNPGVNEAYFILAHREIQKVAEGYTGHLAELDRKRGQMGDYNYFMGRTGEGQSPERDIQLSLQRRTADELVKREALKTNHGAYMMKEEQRRAAIDTEGHRRAVLGRPSMAGFFKRHLGLGE